MKFECEILTCIIELMLIVVEILAYCAELRILAAV